MPDLCSIPAPGQIVRVRQRLYLVDHITDPIKPGDCHLVHLSCVDDDNQGQPLAVLWEHEIDTSILQAEAWNQVASRGFDPETLFAAYYNTIRWNCVTSTDPRLFQSPFRAGIRLDAYQLEPLRKALRLPRVNLFIADDVGLGKTIEAGLIARELLLRKKAREIIVACPPSMLLQWQEELVSRFGLTFVILDKEYIKSVRRERGFSVNPWGTHSRFLVSHRLLIDEAYTTPLRDWLGTFRSGTLLILDEAHHAAPASGQKYAIDSKITRAVRDLAYRFEHRLFLSATPHNGHSNSFSALLEILDPQRFCRGVKPTKENLDAILVRRIKDDLRAIQGGFPKRVVKQVDIEGLPPDAPELVLSDLLDQYRTLRERRLENETKKVQASSGLLLVNLQQRLLSSIEAFCKTLLVHRKTVRRQVEQADEVRVPAPLPMEFDLLKGSLDPDDERAVQPEEELEAEIECQVEAATLATLPSGDGRHHAAFEQELRLIETMETIAQAARYQPDAKMKKLLEWIKANQCPRLGETGAAWTDVRVIIFTEYDDTKRYLKQRLEEAIHQSDRGMDRIAIYHGPTPPADREAIKEAFNAHPSQHPVRILIATDAAREGLNLQAHCNQLFHFDVPWNPSRMEQRNGRIDRKLQPRPEVVCHYFCYTQRPEDRILATLVRKTETIKKELGTLSTVIESRLAKGIRRGDIQRLDQEIDTAQASTQARQTVEDELEAARESQGKLRESIDSLRTLLDQSKKSIGLEEEAFRAAISCSLHLIGAPGLHAAQPPDGGPPQFTFPSLESREGGDSTWADTMDTLRAPRKRGERLWEWRRTSPIRPVVFEDPGVVTDAVVHLHLEQRVVQRLLGRFLSQGFVHHDLSRACLAQTKDSIPRVILLGRLCLYGPEAARLHEEIIPVTARWIDPLTRKGTLTPYAKDTETKTLDLLDQALLGRGHPIDEVVKNQLQASAARDIHELLPHLNSRGEEYAAEARVKLATRGEAEAKAMRGILEMQQKHIQRVVEKYKDDDPQGLLFDYKVEEKVQIQANMRYWDKRLVLLQDELQTEPRRIHEVYQVQAQRVEPIGLVYLWPVTG